MEYRKIKKGIFKERPNRFIAICEVDGKDEVCHVKNTGRCKELLKKGVKVYLEESNKENRKTKYDLVSVYKDDMLVNIDSQAPNKVFYEWAKKGYFKNLSFIKPEYTYKNSRFDFYIECENRKIFVEVKGVTLEKDGEVGFPDAPTLRGVKHINELCECVQEGYEAYIFFVIQMEKADYFVPNRLTHFEFADALIKAEKQGVNIKCVNCLVTENTLEIKDFVKVNLNGGKYFG